MTAALDPMKTDTVDGSIANLTGAIANLTEVADSIEQMIRGSQPDAVSPMIAVVDAQPLTTRINDQVSRLEDLLACLTRSLNTLR